MNKIVLITGASKGIGYALIKKMLEQNFFVIGTCKDGKIKGIESENFYPLKMDLSKPLSIENAHKELFAKFKHIDILINNAGIDSDLDTSFPEMKSFEQTFSVNVTGTISFTEPIIDIIKKKRLILNISSKMGSIHVCERTDSVAYRMSKSVLNMYTKIVVNRLKGTINMASIHHPIWVKTTIAKYNIIKDCFTTEQSANKIYNFINKEIKNSVFWNTETVSELLW